MVGPPCGVAAVLWFKSLLSLRVDVCVPEGKDFTLRPSCGQECGWSPVPSTAAVVLVASWHLPVRGFPEASKLGAAGRNDAHLWA